MATKVIMPKQGLQMTEGTITKWLRREGDAVEAGQPLFEMETDKLAIGIDASASGTLLKIIHGEGDTVPITEVIALIGEKGENIDDILDDASKADKSLPEPGNDKKAAEPVAVPAVAASEDKKTYATPRARSLAGERHIDIRTLTGTGPDGLVTEKDVPSCGAPAEEALRITPLAKKLSELDAIDVSGISGTGARGKITKADVEAAVAARKADAAAGRRTRVMPFSSMRRIISEKMTQSLREMAQANHRMKVDMTEIIRLREKLKCDGVKVSYTDILVRVVSEALMRFPELNASYSEHGMVLHDYVNMGIAVAVGNGLIVPAIKDADLMTLSEISAVSSALIDKARNGELTQDDYTGGTFTLTNLGMYGIDSFTAIVNPPESAILAVGRITDTPVAAGGQIVIKPVMTLSLTYDHRLIDGSKAAEFLQSIEKTLSDPYILI